MPTLSINKPIPFDERINDEANKLVAAFRPFSDGEPLSKKQTKSAIMCAIICANHLRVNCGLSFISSDNTTEGKMISEQEYWMKVIEKLKQL